MSHHPYSLLSNNLDNASFDSLCSDFRWPVPEKLNVAELVCSRHADGSGKLALICETDPALLPSSTTGGTQPLSTQPNNLLHAPTRYTFDELERLSNQLANVLESLGLKRGERIAVILAQRVETALWHLAAQKMGIISLPLSVLFGDDALCYRLQDSGAKAVLTSETHCRNLHRLSSELPQLQWVFTVADVSSAVSSVESTTVNVLQEVVRQQGEPKVAPLASDSNPQSIPFWATVNAANTDFQAVQTLKDDPAFLLYTSGTTGPPKGALIPQRALIGNLTGFELSQNGFPKAGDCLYTPADWAWTGGLLDGLLPTWFYGAPVVAYHCHKFDAEKTAALMSRHKVSCAFIPPTALKMMRASEGLFARHPSYLRSVMSAGESVGEELLSWGREQLGLDINEMCGQTEHNYIMGNCSAIMPVRPGSMGKAYPGHRIAIVNEAGELLPTGEVGEIVSNRHDPVHFLGYWNKPEATAKKYTGDWFHTGDVGYQDEAGYLWFMGRADDVINSAGYRIGPGEIEDCVMKHPAVLQVAAIGVPDPQQLRGDIVKLCVVLRENEAASDALAESIRLYVRDQLAAYEYPRLIQFYDKLPMTTTGKVKRLDLRQMHLDSVDGHRL